MRTPLSRVRGLGSAKDGTEHFVRQRLTAIANLILIAIVTLIFASLAGASHAEIAGRLGSPVVTLVLLAAILSVTYHMKLGMQIIIEDYVHGEGLKLAALAANNFFSAAVALISAYALLMIGFGG